MKTIFIKSLLLGQLSFMTMCPRPTAAVLHEQPQTIAPVVPVAMPPDEQAGKKMQIVFCLDVTSSMDGLIATAKQKIWSIASSMLQQNPKPDIEMGLVFYRDRGDAFVTRKIDFTNDIDSAYIKLMEIRTMGGGDAPESVNEALYNAVNKFQWNTDTSIYKAIFLVGDCPPHMDYQDDVKYPVTCGVAAKKGIFINALKMGNCSGAERVWKETAQITGGDYIPVDESANGYVITTPYDDEIARLQNTVDNTVVYYGTATVRYDKELKKAGANRIYSEGKASENASRAEYKYSKGMMADTYFGNDLVKDLSAGRVKADTIKAAYLPDNMKPMSVEQRKAYISNMKATRDSAQVALNQKIAKRNEYLKTKAAAETDKSTNSFSSKIFNTVKNQTAKKGLKIDGKAKE